MTELEPKTYLSSEQAEFIVHATMMVWSQQANRVEKQFDDCDIAVYRILMIIRVDIKLKGLQPS